jgi:hypothetical protein
VEEAGLLFPVSCQGSSFPGLTILLGGKIKDKPVSIARGQVTPNQIRQGISPIGTRQALDE